MDPAELPKLVAREAAAAAFHDLEIMLVDRQQQYLCSLSSDASCAVDATLPGDVFRRKRNQISSEPGGTRVFVPLVDGVDRLGVLSAVVEEVTERVVADLETLAAFTAELYLSKSAYTDEYEEVRRLQPMDVAAELRWALMPPLTARSPRCAIAGLLEPAYDAAGDAFDYAINGDFVHVAMFDAVGHGLRASRLATLAVSAYRSVRRRGGDLAESARVIDEALIDQFGESWFTTAVLGELDLRRGRFQWLNAGHPRPLLLRGGKVVATLEAPPAAPLGLGLGEPKPADVQLEPGDAVFLYSDGVTEARSDAGDFFGEDRLADHLARGASEGLLAAEMMRRLVIRLYKHRPAPLRDDATVLYLEWRGK
jgi:serine phosphatase RsbU (regulator of sigma subunit)